jgi:hypothetical protein
MGVASLTPPFAACAPTRHDGGENKSEDEQHGT